MPVIHETDVGKPREFLAHENPVVVELSQGNTVRLEPFSVGKVTISTRERVEVELKRGTLHSRVMVPMDWSVRAGPWRVTAEGTVYSVSWHDAKLDVSVTSGRVRVTGLSASQDWMVSAGEKLTVDKGRMARHQVTDDGIRPQPKDREGDPQPVPPMSVEPAGGSVVTPPGEDRPENGVISRTQHPDMMHKPVERVSGAERSPEPVTDNAVPEWKQALSREEFARAVHLVEQGGLIRFADSASLPDLQALANAARFAGRGSQAKTLLLALRSRFPQTGQAAVAAFLLGRVHAELLQDPKGAVDWFSAYLKEAPSGPLFEEALGRKMDVAHRGGRSADARTCARELIQKYPESPFIPQARRILGIEEPAWAK